MSLYRSGQPMPSNVLAALMYTAKVGVLSRKIWNVYFAKGTTRWKRMQLKFLVDRGLLKAHTCDSLDSKWTLTYLSEQILKENNVPFVPPVPPQYVDHDEVVAESLLRLSKTKFCESWQTERELKTLNYDEYLIMKREGEVKYPDGVMKACIRGKIRTIAVEYERTGKSTGRYRAILWQYGRMSNFTLVLYIYEDLLIKRRIQSALKFIGHTELMRRMAYVDAYEWKKDPFNAPIEFRNTISSFNKMCTGEDV